MGTLRKLPIDPEETISTHALVVFKKQKLEFFVSGFGFSFRNACFQDNARMRKNSFFRVNR